MPDELQERLAAAGLDEVEFASPEAAEAALEAGLGPEDFDGEDHEAETGFGVRDVERLTDLEDPEPEDEAEDLAETTPVGVEIHAGSSMRTVDGDRVKPEEDGETDLAARRAGRHRVVGGRRRKVMPPGERTAFVDEEEDAGSQKDEASDRTAHVEG